MAVILLGQVVEDKFLALTNVVFGKDSVEVVGYRLSYHCCKLSHHIDWIKVDHYLFPAKKKKKKTCSSFSVRFEFTFEFFCLLKSKTTLIHDGGQRGGQVNGEERLGCREKYHGSCE